MIMTKYRKKPLVVEAWQWFENDGQIGPILLGWTPNFCDACRIIATSSSDPISCERHTSSRVAVIETLEGFHEVTDGDWIITGVKGERYACKPDVFELTYELVE